MRITPTQISDVLVLEPQVFEDERGYFMESFNLSKLVDYLGYQIKFCQDNESMSAFGVLRGLHYQLTEFAQTKLVRVVKGKVLDVAVDIRKGSPYFGKHIAVELSEENKKQLFIPRGFAHGFVVLSSSCIFSYKVDNYYNKPSERSLIYKDTSLSIDWQLAPEDLKLSAKDEKAPQLDKVLDKDLFHYKDKDSFYATI